MPEIARLEAVVTADTSHAEKSLDNLGGKISGLGPMWGAIGAGAAVAGVAVAAGLAKGVMAAGDLEQSVANISTIKPDIDTSAVFGALNEMSTRVPQTAAELGDGLYNIFSSIETTQAGALRLNEQFAQSAVGAGTNVETFGTAALGVMNAYGMSVEEAGHISDVFFNTVNKGVITGQELASSLGPVTQSAKAAGVSLDELGGLIAGVTKEGGPAAQNVNNLNNFLQKVTTKEAQRAMSDLGVVTKSATGDFLPTTTVLTSLSDKLETMTEAGRANALQKIFPDAQARIGAQTLISQLDFVKTAIGDNISSAGSAESAFAKMNATFNSQVKILGNTFNSLLTTIGGTLLPVITPLIVAFSQHLPGAFAATAVALAPVGAAFLQLASGVQTAFGLVAASISALLAGDLAVFVQTLEDNLDIDLGPFVGIFMSAFQLVQGVIGAFVDVFEGIGPVVDQALTGDVGGAIQSMLGILGGASVQIVEALATWAAAFLEWVGPMIPPLLAQLGTVLVGIVTWVAAAIPVIVAQLATWADAFVAWILPMIPVFMASMALLLGELVVWATGTALPAIIAQLVTWGTAFVAWIAPMIPPFLAGMADLMAQIGAWITGVAGPAIVAGLVTWATAFVAWIGPMIPPFITEMATLLTRLAAWITLDARTDIAQSLLEWGRAFIEWIKPMIPQVINGLVELNGTIQRWMLSAATELGRAALALGTSIITGVLTGITQSAGRLFEGIRSTITSAVEKVKSNMGSTAEQYMAYTIGAPMAEGLIQGLVTNFADGDTRIGDAIRAVVETAIANNIDPIIAAALAKSESNFRPWAVGDAGASKGLFQLHERGQGAGMGDSRLDPWVNAVKFLSQHAGLFAQMSQDMEGANLATMFGGRAEVSDPQYWHRYGEAFNEIVAALGSMGPVIDETAAATDVLAGSSDTAALSEAALTTAGLLKSSMATSQTGVLAATAGAADTLAIANEGAAVAEGEHAVAMGAGEIAARAAILANNDEMVALKNLQDQVAGGTIPAIQAQADLLIGPGEAAARAAIQTNNDEMMQLKALQDQIQQGTVPAITEQAETLMGPGETAARLAITANNDEMTALKNLQDQILTGTLPAIEEQSVFLMGPAEVAARKAILANNDEMTVLKNLQDQIMLGTVPAMTAQADFIMGPGETAARLAITANNDEMTALKNLQDQIQLGTVPAMTEQAAFIMGPGETAARKAIQTNNDWTMELHALMEQISPGVTGAIETLNSTPPEIDTSSVEAAAKEMDKARKAAEKLADALDDLDSSSNAKDDFERAKGKGINTAPNVNMDFFASGGMVRGPLGSPQPAIVHGGEMILNPQQQRDVFGEGGANSGGVTYNFFGVTVEKSFELAERHQRKQAWLKSGLPR